MRKTDKKIDNTIISALTDVCHVAQQNKSGFQWVTHNVNYQSFPDSLTIMCVYEVEPTDAVKNEMRSLVADKLAEIGIVLKDNHRKILFENKEKR